jgi:hypothetical protein
MATASDRRAQMRDALNQRTKESIANKDSSGNFTSYLKQEYQDKLWGRKDCKITAATHFFDIVPFSAGDNYPIDIRTKRREVQKGDMVYKVDFWTHRNIGPSEDNVVCLSKTYGQDCPICEDLLEKRKSGEYTEDQVKAFPWAKRRCLYWVLVCDKGMEDTGLMVLDMAHFNMEEKIALLALDQRTGAIINFAHPDHGPNLGHTIQVTREGTGATDTKYIGHKLLPRDYDIEDAFLDAVTPLDDALIVPNYDDLARLHLGKKHIPDEMRSDVSLHNPESDDQDPQDPKPVSSRRGRSVQSESIETTLGKSNAGGDCPGGGTLGVDIDKLTHCQKCGTWNDCLKKEKELATGGESKSPELAKEEKVSPAPSGRRSRVPEPSKEKVSSPGPSTRRSRLPR